MLKKFERRKRAPFGDEKRPPPVCFREMEGNKHGRGSEAIGEIAVAAGWFFFLGCANFQPRVERRGKHNTNQTTHTCVFQLLSLSLSQEGRGVTKQFFCYLLGNNFPESAGGVEETNNNNKHTTTRRTAPHARTRTNTHTPQNTKQQQLLLLLTTLLTTTPPPLPPLSSSFFLVLFPPPLGEGEESEARREERREGGRWLMVSLSSLLSSIRPLNPFFDEEENLKSSF